MEKYFLGIDVGSTTVKYVLCNENLDIIKSAYKAHHTKQAQTLLTLLEELQQNFSNFNKITSCFITGSGASRIAPLLNATFIQEVNAVTLAVKKLHSDVSSVIELGGQDAKIIIFKKVDNKEQIITQMNDKCASGTGATIEKALLKLQIPNEKLNQIAFNPKKLHFISAKCGVFAETDIVNLLKASINKEEILNSLANAIVLQNLTTLTRSNTLKPKVLLLGGPNYFLPFLQEAWRYNLSKLWDERAIKYEKDKLHTLIFAPKNAQLYAAYGAVIFGVTQEYKPFEGLEKLKNSFKSTSTIPLANEDAPLVYSQNELQHFLHQYKLPPFTPKKPKNGEKLYLGIDGGSTSSKAVLINEKNEVLFKAYTLSLGNPIEDILKLLQDIAAFLGDSKIKIAGAGATGYAADVLEKTLFLDVNIIETIAHLKGALEFFGEVDVICDVGGQDIKVLFLENGNLKSFKLSNQCSAGNGAMLQALASQFNIPLEEFATYAFKAKRAPKFNYGCAVFLDSDRVNFQKEGYTQEELFAGMAKVLPKNIWQYIVQAPSLLPFGKRFVLQGGTQYNLAALKAQVDYIKAQVNDAQVFLHPHPGEAGAIGAALEAKEIVQKRGYSTFVGLNEALKLQYTTKTDESTRCTFCSMKCTRTFIDTKLPSFKMNRYIAGFKCERGQVESIEELKKMQALKKERLKNIINLAAIEEKALFNAPLQTQPLPKEDTPIKKKITLTPFGKYGPVISFFKKSKFKRSKSKKLTIAMPKALNIYALAPFFRAYFQTLGINLLFSPNTNQKLFLKGAKYSAIDPCFPAKVSLSHTFVLLNEPRYKNVDVIYFPSIVNLESFLEYTQGSTACPIVSGTPMVCYSALTKEQNLFKKHNKKFLTHPLDFSNKDYLKQELFKSFGKLLNITQDESDFAAMQALQALNNFKKELELKGKKLILDAIKYDKIILLLLGRPYHLDSGINHGILDEFQALGFHILTIDAIPKDKDFLKPFFQDDLAKGKIKSVFDINDVWQENFSANSAAKVWAAKFAAMVKNIAVIDLSSFKCGHNAPTYSIIDKILGTSKTPYLMLHDLDANKPSGSLQIRIKTFAYTLQKYQEQLKVAYEYC